MKNNDKNLVEIDEESPSDDTRIDTDFCEISVGY